MDIAQFLQRFESSLTSYKGDDPLEQWDKFVESLERRLPADDHSGMSQVFDTLVGRFLNVERYANDARYVNYCIRCASYYSDPVSLYSHIFSRGVGARTAALYLAWAQQLEQRGMGEQAEAVFQKALENQAQPADAVLHEYRQFQARSRGQTPGPGDQAPLQNSNLTNQPTASQPSLDCPSKPPASKTTVISVSRSETSATLRSRQQGGDARVVSAYAADELVCEGSELCFEEVRAARYFRKLREKQEEAQRQLRDMTLNRQFQSLGSTFGTFDRFVDGLDKSTNQTAAQRADGPSERPPLADRPTSRRSAGLSLRSEPLPVLEERSTLSPAETSASFGAPPAASFDEDGGARLDGSTCCPPQQFVVQPLEPEEETLDASQGAAANLSHVTPNTSLGFVQATPSRALPSPTVNTREALGVIMDMFQAPTFLADTFSHASVLHAAAEGEELSAGHGNVSAAAQPPASTPFTIFQDENDKENGGAAAPPATPKSKPVRALCDITASKTDKPNDTPTELAPDESTVWSNCCNSLHSLAACPNSTTDFALLAHCVSTPSANKTGANIYQDQENSGDVRRQTNKLSPIIEQSPSEETLSASTASRLAPSSAQQGTIVGEELASAPLGLTVVQPPPPAVLSFRAHTLCPAETSGTAGPGWEAYADPEPARDSESRVPDVPMSPDCPLKPNWMSIGSPERPVQSDLDAFASPRRMDADVPESPERPPPCADVPMSPQQGGAEDEPMAMSPDRGSGRAPPVSDPWDGELIARLLSALDPPLTSRPNCISWQCSIPRIAPKMTISMGRASLRVDGVVGEGAFATVYQVTDPATSERMVLKVQKPANPWEFYINTQLDARLPPDARRLFSSFRSAHLFHDGSVMLGELHNLGTLLNAVNIYKTLSDKLMPRPLVMYFAACILHMVEQLHAARIVHADVKPDNFLLGERFLENRCFDSDGSDHGLVLADLGQSIDMRLFPDGTAFTARCLTSGFQCTEMLSGKPWSYQTDYFGVAGTVHCMLFGTYMQVSNEDGVWKTNGVFRRDPHSELWQDFFHSLLNAPPGDAPPGDAPPGDAPPGDAPPGLRRLRLRLASELQRSYGSKLATLKNRLVVLLLESHRAARQ